MDRLESLRKVVDEILRQQPDMVERRCGFVHLYGVSTVCAMLAIKRGLDSELCAAAGMMHDISTYKTGDSTNHVEYSSIEAEKILLELDMYSKEEISSITAAIWHHNKKQEVNEPICELLKDADVLQHYLYNTTLSVKDKNAIRLKKLLEELRLNAKVN